MVNGVNILDKAISVVCKKKAKRGKVSKMQTGGRQSQFDPSKCKKQLNKGKPNSIECRWCPYVNTGGIFPVTRCMLTGNSDHPPTTL